MNSIPSRAKVRRLLAVAAFALPWGPGLAEAQQVIAKGGILSGELQAMRARGPDGKRVSSFQLVSEPRKLPGPDGLCNLETGPETFQLMIENKAQAAQLKGLLGKQIAVKVDQVSCAQDAGQLSEAVVTKWSLVKR
jgi:hypothetical protein